MISRHISATISRRDWIPLLIFDISILNDARGTHVMTPNNAAITEAETAYKAAPEPAARTQAAVNLASAYSATIMDHMEARQYAEGEALLAPWRAFLQSLTEPPTHLIDHLFVQYHTKVGDLNVLAAQDAYELNSDFIGATNRYDRAEHHFQKALEAFAKASNFEGADTPEGQAMIATQSLFLNRGLADAEGMHAMIEGEYNLESGDYENAAKFLDTAVAKLESADAATAQMPPEDQGMPTFTNFARALRHRTETETQLIAGNLEKAASAEQSRADALRAAAKEHAISELSTSEFFRRRTKRDQLLAEERARFLGTAAKQAVAPSLGKRLAFPALAFAGVTLLVYLTREMEILQNPLIFIFILFFAMVIAAITAGLTSYKDGERTLTALANAAREKSSE